MKRILIFSIITLFLITFLIGCSESTKKSTSNDNNSSKKEEINSNNDKSAKEKKSIILATTTSTENSGLLDYIIPNFEEKYGREVKVIAVGTGKALTMGENGEADVLLVHAKSSEEAFVEAGHGIKRYDVMYNDFVFLGPKEQTLIDEESSSAVKVLTKIAEEKGTFVSRGDDSGTHKKELSLWEDSGIKPEGDWYVSAGKGMGDTITMADEMEGYTLSDRATYLSRMKDVDLEIVAEGDELLFNQYGVIPVNPEKSDMINKNGAEEFVEWILGDTCQSMIEEFGKEKFGQSLFVPNGK
ncbi:MAG: substrate-binding domain-containing protein [Clostridiales bacterium]